MTYAQTILPEFDEEMANARKVLERIPDDKLEWRAHPESNTIGWNANHLAEIAGWVAVMLQQATWEIAPPGGEPYRSPALKTRNEIVELFDHNVAAARNALAEVKDEAMGVTWSLLYEGKPIITMSRAAVIRRYVLNHVVHHRAILCVYLRLNDIPVPGMYDPSGGE
jgi:uncharacterized damage-inducible protein DinB